MPSPSDAGAVALPCIPQPASLVGVSPGPSSAPQQLTAAELREKRLAYLERSQPPSKEPQEEGEGEEEEEEEEDEETVINGEMETERLPPSECFFLGTRNLNQSFQGKTHFPTKTYTFSRRTTFL